MKTGGNTAVKRRMSINRLKNRDVPCPNGMIKHADGACYQINGVPSKLDRGVNNATANFIAGTPIFREGGKIRKMQEGGEVNDTKINRNIRSKQTPVIDNRVGGGVKRRTITSNGHFHEYIVDIHGNGKTTNGTHVHPIKDNKVQMVCAPKCHSHGS